MDRRFFGNAAVGALTGYIVYLAISAGFEVLGNDRFDVHHFLSAAAAVLYVPLFLSRSSREQFEHEQILDCSLVWFLILAGTITAVWVGMKSRRSHSSVRDHRVG